MSESGRWLSRRYDRRRRRRRSGLSRDAFHLLIISIIVPVAGLVVIVLGLNLIGFVNSLEFLDFDPIPSFSQEEWQLIGRIAATVGGVVGALGGAYWFAVRLSRRAQREESRALPAAMYRQAGCRRWLFATVDDCEEWLSLIYEVSVSDTSRLIRAREYVHLTLGYLPAVLQSNWNSLRR